MHPLVLDLFCGAGGAAQGYYNAGFDVIGVDLKPQYNYPFQFVQADALDFLRSCGAQGVALIHASPPCQAYTATTGNMTNSRKDHPRLIEPTRELLKASGVPYVIENVVGAPLVEPVQLCGSTFGLGVQYEGPTGPHGWHQLRRHRLFETNWQLPPADCVRPHTSPTIGIYGDHASYNRRRYGSGKGQYADREKLALASQAMRIDWMTWDEIKEAIPPAYTTYIGIQFRSVVLNKRAAA